jgi:regulatory protein
VREDLARRGVERAVADAAVARAMADAGTDEVRVAEQAARKKVRTLAHLPPPEQRRKLFAHLARQGYALEIVRRAVGAVLAPRAPGEDDAHDDVTDEEP